MTARNCVIITNTNADYGGGIYIVSTTNSLLENCLIAGNQANSGAGIYTYGAQQVEFNQCTIVDNTCNSSYYGALRCSLTTSLHNSIVWNNTYTQITGDPVITYSDIQDSYTGTGNIDLDPDFIDPSLNEYNLAWGSPCIDAGNPDPAYNDPDGTIADMGAYFFNQSGPVRMLLVPHDYPIYIPESGGSIDFDVYITKIAEYPLNVNVWCSALLPDGTVIPTMGPTVVPMGTIQTLVRTRIQAVPAAAPMGSYLYSGFAVAEGDTSQDSFDFVKMGGGESAAAGWDLANLIWDDIEASNEAVASEKNHVAISVTPNPFNPVTAISFQQLAFGYVNLAVYDMSGRKVATLVDGCRDEGRHEVTFDGTGLAAGVYFYRMETGEFIATGKMVLLK